MKINRIPCYYIYMRIKTSITLPNFSIFRLYSILSKLNTSGLHKTPSEVIYFCILKMQKHFPEHLLHREKSKLYNQRIAGYKKQNIRWDLDLYNILHMRAHKARVSVSFITDVAITFFLGEVFKELLEVHIQNHNPIIPRSIYSTKIRRFTGKIWVFTEIYGRPP